MTAGETPVRLRPLGSPLPLGFLALAVATGAFAALQLDWVAPDAAGVIALAALVFAAPLQLVVSVLAFLARDADVGTGMGLLAGTWAVVGVATAQSAPGSTSPGLGVVLLASAACLVVAAVAAGSKRVAQAVIGLSAVRFAVTGGYELLGSGAWAAVAGWVGIALAGLALYAATALLLEATGASPPPIGRPHPVAEPPGVRPNL